MPRKLWPNEWGDFTTGSPHSVYHTTWLISSIHLDLLGIAQVAERATYSPLTVNSIEKSSPTVSIGIYARVLYAQQLDDDLLLIAKEIPRDFMRETIKYAETRRKSPKIRKFAHSNIFTAKL